MTCLPGFPIEFFTRSTVGRHQTPSVRAGHIPSGLELGALELAHLTPPSSSARTPSDATHSGNSGK